MSVVVIYQRKGEKKERKIGERKVQPCLAEFFSFGAYLTSKRTWLLTLLVLYFRGFFYFPEEVLLLISLKSYDFKV